MGNMCNILTNMFKVSDTSFRVLNVEAMEKYAFFLLIEK